MSENGYFGVRRALRVACIGAGAAAFGLLSAGSAGADVFVPLPDGEKAGPGGNVVARTGESALVSPSLAMNGAGRVVWVNGVITARVATTPKGEVGPFNGPTNADGTNNSSTHGTSRLSAGYIVGCQVDINGLSGGLSASLSPSALGGGLSATIPLEAGEVKWVQVDGKDIESAGTYSVEYKDLQMEIQNCGGFAQARSYAVLEVIGDHYSKTTLYGQPFSIG